jgi:HlyD family secretion protein
VGGCSCSSAVTVQTAAASPTVSVVVARPEAKSVKWNIEQPGTIQAFEVAPLMVKFPGYVQKVFVDIDDRVDGPEMGSDGRIVKPGTLLAQLSVPEVVEELKLKEALVRQALSEIEVARQNLLVASANVRSADKKVDEMASGEKRTKADFERWDSESKRVDVMVSRGSVDKATGEETRNQRVSAQSAWDEAVARTVSAQAARQESEAKVRRAEAEIKAAEARHVAAEAEARRVKALKDYTEIRAPFSGIVTGRFVHAGHFLQPASGSRAEPLFVVSRIDPVRVLVDVPEQGVDQISKNTTATIRIPALRGVEFKGKVARTSWSLNNESRTLRVEIDVPNPDGRIRPGMFANASIPVEIANSVVIPTSAVFQQDEMNLCYLVEDGKAARYQLRLGQGQTGTVEVLQKRRTAGKSPWTLIDGGEAVVAKYEGPIEDGAEVVPTPSLPKR